MAMYDAQRLVEDCDPLVPLGPFDAESAFAEDEWVVTSPNQRAIPYPPWGRHDVNIRADYRYGHDDYTLWPQPYVAEYPHLGSIPRKPTDSKNPISCMWWDLTESDFRPSSNSIASGMGQLSPSRYVIFQYFNDQLRARVSAYKKLQPRPNEVLLSLANAAHHSCLRLGFMSTTYAEMRFGVTEYQRYYLEVVGILDYLEIYKPIMDGKMPRADKVAETIGAYTTIPRVAQDFFEAGLPVYLIRRFADLPSDPRPNILTLVKPILPDNLVLSQAQPSFPSIYRGSSSSPHKHEAMHKYSRTWMVYKDPFSETTGPNASNYIPMSVLMEPRLPDMPTSSTACSNVTASSKISKNINSASPTASFNITAPPKPSKVTRSGGRDKFIDLDSPLVPPAMAVWANALKNVDRSPSRLIQGRKALAHYGHYALPEPSLLVTPANDEKKASYLLTWLRARPVLLYRLCKENSTALSNQTWRNFLEMGRSSGKEGASKSAKSRELIRQILGKNIIPSSSPTVNSLPVPWGTKMLAADQMPSPNVFREVLWELFELNFRIELFSLDARATTNNPDPQARLERIQQCFSGFDFLEASIPSDNKGLVADHWEDRRPFILALRDVVSSWIGCPQMLKSLTQQELNGNISKERVLELEHGIALFYTQSFFNYFGRAALLPHRITTSFSL